MYILLGLEMLKVKITLSTLCHAYSIFYYLYVMVNLLLPFADHKIVFFGHLEISKKILVYAYLACKSLTIFIKNHLNNPLQNSERQIELNTSMNFISKS